MNEITDLDSVPVFTKSEVCVCDCITNNTTATSATPVSFCCCFWLMFYSLVLHYMHSGLEFFSP